MNAPPRTRRTHLLSGLAVVALAGSLTSCSGSTPSGSPAPKTTAVSAPGGAASSNSITPSAPPVCPNPEGYACLGPIAAGTYSTTVFRPQITYTVPAGWSNLEDTSGNFLLVPPGFDLPGVNRGTSDFIGIYASVAAPNGCNPGTALGVPTTSAGVVRWVQHNPALAITNARPVTVGGLSGVVMDVRLSPTWKKACLYSGGHPVAPLIVGVNSSGLDHNVGPGNATRLYLLNNAGAALCVEVSDVRDAHHLDRYSSIVNRLKFTG